MEMREVGCGRRRETKGEGLEREGDNGGKVSGHYLKKEERVLGGAERERERERETGGGGEGG